MSSQDLQRHIERHKSKDPEKAAVAITILFGMSIALTVIGADTARSIREAPAPRIHAGLRSGFTAFARRLRSAAMGPLLMTMPV